MELDDDLKQLIKDFASIATSYGNIYEECNLMKNELKEKTASLKILEDRLCLLETDCQVQKSLVETVAEQVSVIPEYKTKIADLTQSISNVEKILKEKNDEISRLNQKHIGDIGLLYEKIESERKQDREEEERRIEEMGEFLKKEQEEEIVSLTKQAEREKRLLIEQLESVEEKLLTIQVEHEEEIEAMKVHLAAANRTSTYNSSASAEIFKKKLLEMQQHYETQIQDLLDTRDGLKTPGSDQDSSCSLVTPHKKKKVRFNQFVEKFPSPVINNDLNTFAMEENDNMEVKSFPESETFQSLFFEAKKKFAESPSKVFSTNVLKTIDIESSIGVTDLSLMEEVICSADGSGSNKMKPRYSISKTVSSKDSSQTMTTTSVRNSCITDTRNVHSVSEVSPSPHTVTSVGLRPDMVTCQVSYIEPGVSLSSITNTGSSVAGSSRSDAKTTSLSKGNHPTAAPPSCLTQPRHSTSKTRSGYNFKFTSRPSSTRESGDTDFITFSVEDGKSPSGARKGDLSSSRYGAVVDVGFNGDEERCHEMNTKDVETSVTTGTLKRKLFTPSVGPQAWVYKSAVCWGQLDSN